MDEIESLIGDPKYKEGDRVIFKTQVWRIIDIGYMSMKVVPFYMYLLINEKTSYETWAKENLIEPYADESESNI